MVYLADLAVINGKFVYAIFGIQYDSLTEQKSALIRTLHKLLCASAGQVDCLQEEDHGVHKATPKTTTFVAYWLNSSDYEVFNKSNDFQTFWNGLSDHANVWREIMTVPKSRYMFAASQPVKWGLASMLELKQSSDEGYWGVYRHRLSETPDDFTDPEDVFTSSYVTAAKLKPEPHEKIINIPAKFSNTIVPGRVRLRNIPDNLVFVREGQRQQHVPVGELETWMEQIAPHAQSWITHLDSQRNKNGVITFTTHVGHEKPIEEGSTSDKEITAESDQLAFFLDLAHFEKAGRAHKGHVELRRTVMSLYGPGGVMSKGKAELFVELCVLKKGDLDAEYVGCAEGTGLLHMRSLDK